MKRAIYITTIILCAVICVQCNSIKKIEAQAYPINYTELQNYFVQKEAISKQIQRVIIDNEQQFEHYFGEADMMARNGQYTQVNFKTQYVLAVILPVTNRATIVIPAEISQVDDTVIFNYRVRKGNKQDRNVVPFAAVVIDKPVSDTKMEFIFKEL